MEHDSRAEEPQLVCERKVRIKGKRDMLEKEILFRIWRMPPGAVDGVPTWMSCYTFESSFPGYKRDFQGLDDLQALASCLLEVDSVLITLQKGNELWIGEQPFDPKLWSVFFGKHLAELKAKFDAVE